MSAVFFHCTDEQHVLLDRKGTAMDLADAHLHAERLVRTYVSTPSVEDWRNWVLHVTDDLGNELFDLPFAAVLGPLH